MLDANFVRLLEQEQATFAVEAMKPNAGTEFEYGYRCGVMAGLQAAKNRFISLLDEEKGDRDE